MNKEVYFPVRLGVTIDSNVFNIVRIIDESSRDFITIEHHQFESFFGKILYQDPLIIIEEFDLDANPRFSDTKRRILTDLLVKYLTSRDANILLLGIPRIPVTYVKKYQEQTVPINYHKPLWLCSFNKSKTFE